MRKLAGLLPLLLITMLPTACYRSQASTTSASLVRPAEPPDGGEILQRACTVCHNLGGLGAYAGSWGVPEWRSMVETMISYGAQVTPTELDALSHYLAVNFGTEGPGTEAASESAPAGSGEMATLLESACTSCHGLELLETNTAGFNAGQFRDTVVRMIQYGAPVAENQIEPMVAYLTETYGN